MRNMFNAGLTGLLLLFAGAASASVVTVSYANGEPYTFTDENSDISISGTRQAVNIWANGPDRWLHVDLAAPRGESLRRGVFHDAERASFRTGRAPGVDAGYWGSGCNEVWGEFAVRQIAFDAAGNVKSLEATFERSCFPNDPNPLIGVIKVNVQAWTFLYDSPPGDWIGLGARKQFYGHTSDMVLSGTPAGMDYAVSGDRQDWSITMTPPAGKRFVAGTYQTSGIL